MKYKYMLIFLVVAMIACQPIIDEPVSMPNATLNDTTTEQEEQNQTQQVDETLASYRLTVTEGELARIPLNVYDPDGDDVRVTVQEPFNQDGFWLTQIGDEGRYLIQLQASDGLITTTEYVLVDVLRANRPPIVECPNTINVTETENVTINCNIVDPEGHDFVISYEGWMTSRVRETTFGDRGTHTVIVRATDEKGASSSSEVTVNVARLNRPPVVEALSDKTVAETETIRLNVVASDPDGAPVQITFSEPFDENGVFTPDFGDRGTYNVSVTVSDGQASTVETFSLTVTARSRPPVLEPIAPITVFEGETVRIPINAYDPDGNDLIISYSGWMNSRTYTTTYDDAHPNGCNERGCTATYYTTVTVSDCELSTSQEVQINVVDRNRPPVFIFN